MTDTRLLTTTDHLRALSEALGDRPRIGIDVESNGLFRYRATLCTIQLIGAPEAAPADANEIAFVVDALAAPLPGDRMPALLGPEGPQKIVHDVAFDARILAEAGLPLGNVFDTSIAARMLGRTATGLASLLMSELGLTVDKKLQHHDWTERPIRATELRYLADDVVHLGRLADKLAEEVAAKDIAAEIAEETIYRVKQATEAAGTFDPRPPYLRLKGIDRVPKEQLPILRQIASIREDKARSLDVPPYKVLGPDILFAIAQARPQNHDELGKIKGATSGGRARAIASAILEGVRRGLEEGTIPDEDRALMEKPRIPPAIAKARRMRESKLTSWRKAEAKRRGVDEQVVLPGHCLQDLADLDEGELEPAAIDTVPGIGEFRAERYGAALLELLQRRETVPSAEGGEAL